MKNDSLLDLPPTSHSIVNGHIPRWHYIVRLLSNLLNPDFQSPSPLENGWKEDNESLLPEKNLLVLPENLTCICNCKTHDTSRRCKFKQCKCVRFDSICTEYCGCKRDCINMENHVEIEQVKNMNDSIYFL